MIGGHITGAEAVARAERHVESLSSSRQAYSVEFTVACRQEIERALVRILQDRARHFDVIITEDGLNMSISVQANSEVGKAIYYGTQPHSVVARSGQSMPMSGNRFMQAEHPGTKAQKPKIDMAVKEAIATAKASMGYLGSRG